MLKDKVLNLLELQKGDIVTGGQLASVLGVSRNAVWKAIGLLRNDGNEIVSIPNKGYMLMGTNDTLSENAIGNGLKAKFVGQKIKLLPTVHSTNQYLKEIDTTNIDSGFVVIADEQTRGRGRRGRAFLSSKSQGVYLSILLKLGSKQQDTRLLTICAAVAVSKAIEKVCGIRADIKWVNDIFCNGKKICGILTEATISGELLEISSVIAGIGINTGSVPEELSDIATSIQEVSGIRGIRNQLIAEVLNEFESVIVDYTEHGKTQEIIDYYTSRLFIIGKLVYLPDIADNYPATVIGISDIGALIVKDDKGDIQHITTGEIELF
ncbi:MAG: biotin--[acetyl-CoA-carboxylase] ligase [Oscillospiraceae bacterium]|nr:biotin--[acetyl-CoA-carboxylase] ligase [Oscillospiraceae bacterium]